MTVCGTGGEACFPFYPSHSREVSVFFILSVYLEFWREPSRPGAVQGDGGREPQSKKALAKERAICETRQRGHWTAESCATVVRAAPLEYDDWRVRGELTLPLALHAGRALRHGREALSP